jgi:hypothetical protein
MNAEKLGFQETAFGPLAQPETLSRNIPIGLMTTHNEGIQNKQNKIKINKIYYWGWLFLGRLSKLRPQLRKL